MTKYLNITGQGFPDWRDFQKATMHQFGFRTLRGWAALGFAWIREYTHELLPWFELLPQTDHLPLMWNKTERNDVLLNGTDALEEILNLEQEFQTVKPYIDILGLTEEQVRCLVIYAL